METTVKWLQSGTDWFFLDYYKPDELSEQNPGSYFPKASHMLLPSIAFGVLLVGVRMILER